MVINLQQYLDQAKELAAQGRHKESRHQIIEYLLHDHALLWLARVTPDPEEAVTAAELAFKLSPENEVTQRARAAIAAQIPSQSRSSSEIDQAVENRTGLSLREARACHWPFRNINLSIGQALDEAVITSKDLLWASENAYDPRIKEAAKTILYHEVLGNPQTVQVSPSLKVIQCSRYSEGQERIAVLISGMLVTLVILSWLGLLGLSILGMLELVNLSVLLFLGFAGVGILLLYLLMELLERFSDRWEQFRAGRYGEEKAVEALRDYLDGRWTLYRNFEWPYRKWGDIDLVLVGPGGVWVFEVKAYSGNIRNRGDEWDRKTRFGWRKISTHPGKQARRNATRLNEYLKLEGQPIRWVNPVVIWAETLEEDKDNSLLIAQPAVPVWRIENFDSSIDALWEYRQQFSDEQAEKINSILLKAVEEAKAQKD